MKDEDHVTFGDNAKGKNTGIGNIGNYSSTSIENVLLIDSLKHTLLNISQLCYKCYNIKFDYFFLFYSKGWEQNSQRKKAENEIE